MWSGRERWTLKTYKKLEKTADFLRKQPFLLATIDNFDTVS